MTKTSTKPAGGKRLLQNKLFSITLILVGMVIIAALTSEYFMTAYNLQSVIRDLAFIGIIAIGQSCLLLLGEKFLWGGVLNKTPALVRHGYTMLAVVISWVLFRSVDLPQAWAYLGAMFGQTTGLAQDGQAAYYLLEYWPEWLLAIVASLPVKGWLQEKLRQGGNLGQTILIWAPKGLALGLLGLSYLKLVTSSFNPFIYFQF